MLKQLRARLFSKPIEAPMSLEPTKEEKAAIVAYARGEERFHEAVTAYQRCVGSSDPHIQFMSEDTNNVPDYALKHSLRKKIINMSVGE